MWQLSVIKIVHVNIFVKVCFGFHTYKLYCIYSKVFKKKRKKKLCFIRFDASHFSAI